MFSAHVYGDGQHPRRKNAHSIPSSSLNSPVNILSRCPEPTSTACAKRLWSSPRNSPPDKTSPCVCRIRRSTLSRDMDNSGGKASRWPSGTPHLHGFDRAIAPVTMFSAHTRGRVVVSATIVVGQKMRLFLSSILPFNVFSAHVHGLRQKTRIYLSILDIESVWSAAKHHFFRSRTASNLNHHNQCSALTAFPAPVVAAE